MKICPTCQCEYMDTASKCSGCGMTLIPYITSEGGALSIKGLINRYHNEFPSIFLPYDGFYDNWDTSGIRLYKMVQDILMWLKCKEFVTCTYTFIKEPGRYIYNNGYHYIEINIFFGNDPFKIAAILAHECLHLYMKKNNLEDYDFKINELKTDLLTICSGLGLLVINGMQYRLGALSDEKEWKKSILNEVANPEESLNSFGYFKPEEYCEYFYEYLGLKGFSEFEIMGYIHPQARIFLPIELKKQKTGRKLKIISEREKYWYRNRIIHVIISIIAAAMTIIYYCFYRHLF